MRNDKRASLWLDRVEKTVHTRGGVVLREARLVAIVHAIQRFGSGRGRLPMWQVIGCDDALALPSVDTATGSLDLLRCVEAGMISVMQDQPKLKTWIRDCHPNTGLLSDLKGLVQVRVVLRPLDIEEAPAFIDLLVAQSVCCELNEGKRYPVLWMDLQQ